MIRTQRDEFGNFICTCTACGQQVRVKDPNLFLQRHRCGLMGAGDVTAAITNRLGIKPCKPCERRKQVLNGWFPGVWRR